MMTWSVLASGVRCRACQKYISSSIYPAIQHRITVANPDIRSSVKRQRRDFAHSSMRISRFQIQEEIIAPVNDVEKLQQQADAVSQTKATPWYLQDQTQEQDINPFAERQRIPDLPKHPPAILSPLLNHLSIDLGLDYLSCLDLRNLDPPPALGSNLLMLFGSARSEKHLNVSADRLCRWLRANHKLSPYADGLLGRNELKTRLRRKNRRAKILRAAGASDRPSPDDGITTGWICVNVGTVTNENNDVVDATARNPDFVGFSAGFGGTKIVVQMMTEPKREEIELEALWQGIIDQASLRKAGEEGVEENTRLSTTFDGTEYEQSQTSKAENRPLDRSNLQTAVSGHHMQTRSFHNITFLRTNIPPFSVESVTDLPDESELEPHLIESDSHQATSTNTTSSSVHGHPTSFSLRAQLLALRTQLNYLQSLSPTTAILLLGEGEGDRESTAFLKSFYSNIPVIPEPEHTALEIELHCHAINVGHPDFTITELTNKLSAMQGSGGVVPEATFLCVLDSVLMKQEFSEPQNDTSSRPRKELEQHLKFRLAKAFDVLEWMEAQGYDIRTKQVFTILHKAICEPNRAHGAAAEHSSPRGDQILEPKSIKLSGPKQRRYNYHFRRAIDILYDAPQGDNDIYMSMLTAYADTSDWSSFWDMWRHMARMMRPRPPQMYALMFRRVADTGNEKMCQEVLMTQVPEMGREEPPVQMEGDVARAVVHCLKAAKAERENPPWAKMWRDADAAKVDL